MSQDTTTYDSTVHDSGSSGSIYVPAEAQRANGICIGTDVEVTLFDFGPDFVDSITFTGQQIAGDTVTVPADIMNRLDIDGHRDVQASFAKAESESDDDDDSQSDLADSKGAVDTDGESDDDDDPVDASDDDTSLGELFG
jgi:hypothetical protein